MVYSWAVIRNWSNQTVDGRQGQVIDMRLIDADALIQKMNLAIAALERAMKIFDIEDDPEYQMELKAYKDIRDGIKDEPTIEPDLKWIPCSERLPEYGKPVLWCNEKGSVFTTALTFVNKRGDFAVGKRHRRYSVVAWMPLPDPYREEK